MHQETMKAAVLQAVGSIENLHYTDISKPEPKPGEALIRINAAALNHRDLWIVFGKYAKIQVPAVLGSDACGTVEQVGDIKDNIWVSRRVVVHPGLFWGNNPRAQGKNYKILGMPDQGTLAEYVTVPVENLAEAPGHLSDEAAAALPLAGLTAYRALMKQGKADAGETVVITGVGGGVAALALQMAMTVGAQVVVTSGHDEKIARALSLGASAGYNYKATDMFKKMASDGIEPDLIVDGTGGASFGEWLNLMKPGGRYVTYGATNGNPEHIDLRKIFWKQLTIQGSTMGTIDDFRAMIKIYDQYRLKPAVDKVFSLAECRSAFHRMESSEQFGKIILKP
ncbi:zinc-binding dehydrogenase [bacterium]|nr:zinc-binding dehydrogenase [bacterium]NUN45633.1 zinc-binding dehydrogenase [bacterium]